jgi:glycosyltransferase involved in cell wall biosynthesis
MFRPNVSIIVPVYNTEKYLNKCINSLISQTLKNIEIILVDDGSLDNCSKICDDYKKIDDRIKVIHKENAGLGYARNSGLEIAKGEFVAFLDSDDYVNKNMYEILYAEAKKKSLNAVFCGYKRVYKDKYIKEIIKYDKSIIYKDIKEAQSVLLDMVGAEPSYPMDYKLEVSSCMAVYFREILTRHSILFCSERDYISEDYLFNIDFLSKSKKIGFLAQALYYYRRNEVSLTRCYKEDRFVKRKKLFIEANTRLGRIFDTNIFQTRADRAFIGNVRVIISIEVANIIRLTYSRVKQNIINICNDELLRVVLNRFPYKKLPVMQKMFFLCIKKRSINLLILLCILNNIRKASI